MTSPSFTFTPTSPGGGNGQLPTLQTSHAYDSQIQALLTQYAPQPKQDPVGGTKVFVVPDQIYLQIEHGIFPNTASNTDTSGEIPLDSLGGKYKGTQLQASSKYVAPGAPAVAAAAGNVASGVLGSLGLGILGSAKFWEAVGLFLGGAVLVVLAMRQFGGPDLATPVERTVKRAVRV